MLCFCRVAVDNISSGTDTVIKVPNSPFVGFVFSALPKGPFSLCVTNFPCVLLQVDSANKRGSLLEVVQVLTDMNLSVRRAYISSDGEWFMDGTVPLHTCQFSFYHGFCELCFLFLCNLVSCGFCSLASFSCHGSKWEKVYAR